VPSSFLAHRILLIIIGRAGSSYSRRAWSTEPLFRSRFPPTSVFSPRTLFHSCEPTGLAAPFLPTLRMAKTRSVREGKDALASRYSQHVEDGGIVALHPRSEAASARGSIYSNDCHKIQNFLMFEFLGYSMPQNLELSDVRISGTSEKIRINAFEVFDGADAERGWSNLTILKNWELLHLE